MNKVRMEELLVKSEILFGNICSNIKVLLKNRCSETREMLLDSIAQDLKEYLRYPSPIEKKDSSEKEIEMTNSIKVYDILAGVIQVSNLERNGARKLLLDIADDFGYSEYRKETDKILCSVIEISEKWKLVDWFTLEAYYALGSMCWNVSKYDRSKMYYYKALSLVNNNIKLKNMAFKDGMLFWIYRDLGEVYFMESEFSEAIKMLKKAILLQKHENEYEQLATIEFLNISYFNSDMYDETINSSEKGIVLSTILNGKEHSETAEYWFRKAVSLDEKGDIEEAIDSYKVIIECIDKDLAEKIGYSLMRLVALYERTGKAEEANRIKQKYIGHLNRLQNKN